MYNITKFYLEKNSKHVFPGIELTYDIIKTSYEFKIN